MTSASHCLLQKSRSWVKFGILSNQIGRPIKFGCMAVISSHRCVMPGCPVRLRNQFGRPRSDANRLHAQSLPQQKSLISQYRASGSWDFDRISAVSSWQFIFGCFALAAVSLSTFNVLTDLIYSSSSYAIDGASNLDLRILDLRNGYSPEDVFNTLRAWGPRGKVLYTIIEAIDVTFYATAYRGAFMVLINRLSSSIVKETGSKPPQIPVAAFPAVLAQLDRVEDLFQVTVTWTFNDSWTATPVLWQNLVRASSAVNITKWALAAAGTVGVAAMVITLVSLKAARLLQQDQS